MKQLKIFKCKVKEDFSYTAEYIFEFEDPLFLSRLVYFGNRVFVLGGSKDIDNKTSLGHTFELV